MVLVWYEFEDFCGSHVFMTSQFYVCIVSIVFIAMGPGFIFQSFNRVITKYTCMDILCFRSYNRTAEGITEIGSWNDDKYM